MQLNQRRDRKGHVTGRVELAELLEETRDVKRLMGKLRYPRTRKQTNDPKTRPAGPLAARPGRAPAV